MVNVDRALRYLCCVRWPCPGGVIHDEAQSSHWILVIGTVPLHFTVYLASTEDQTINVSNVLSVCWGFSGVCVCDNLSTISSLFLCDTRTELRVPFLPQTRVLRSILIQLKICFRFFLAKRAVFQLYTKRELSVPVQGKNRVMVHSSKARELSVSSWPEVIVVTFILSKNRSDVSH